MSRSAAAWRWYAEMNDDVRHQLIDRGWFGQHGRDDAFERDVAAFEAEADAEYGSLSDPGLDPDFDEAEPVDFYRPARGAEAEFDDLYGESSSPAPEHEQPEPEL